MPRLGAVTRACALAAGLFALTACDTLPRSGPDDGAILRQASAVSRAVPGQQWPYAVVDLTPHVLRYASYPLPGSFGALFSGPAPQIRVGVGDLVQVTVFESAPGGLFIPPEAGVRPGNFVTLPTQVVNADGTITVPYAGRVPAANRAIPAIQDDIESRLADRAIEPQVVVELVDQRASGVTVLGAVGNEGRFPVNPAGDRVLDVLGRAGGLQFPDHESFVTLRRGSGQATVFFNTLIENPQENIFIAPNDTLYVSHRRRSFLAFGATGINGQFFFDADTVTLAESVGRSGGLLDERADPGMVFVYRSENRQVLSDMGVDLSRIDPVIQEVPTIYRVNFRNPAGFFVAKQFPMRDQDILYVSNADFIELVKFVALITTVTGGVENVTGDVTATRRHIRNLTD